MAKDEAMKKLQIIELGALPSKFKTKEFVLESINEHDIYIGVYEIERACVKVDYDILLSIELRVHRKNGHNMTFCNIYKDFITDEEYDKIRTTVLLLN